MSRYMKVVYAEQYRPDVAGRQAPAGTVHTADFRLQLRDPTGVLYPRYVNPGDWVLIDADGDTSVCSDASFKRLWKAVPEGVR